MGFAAVFGGAANTPIASTLLAVELFGADAGAYAGIACVIAYLFSDTTAFTRHNESARRNISTTPQKRA
jgi:H+/Cl- antiporter ClcA